jgi:type II secretory pathway component PulJ
MRLTRVRFTVRRMMVAVAISAVVLGCLVLAHREVNYQHSLVEAEYYHYRAEEVTNPALKAEYAELATRYDRLKRYYRPDR